MGSGMQTRTADELRRLMWAMFEAVGTPPEAARFVGDSLVDANLAGHDSHGVIRILHYLEMVKAGEVDPTATPVLLGTDGATARIDGGWGWGQLAMRLATDTAIELARVRAGRGDCRALVSHRTGGAVCRADRARGDDRVGDEQRGAGGGAVRWARPRHGHQSDRVGGAARGGQGADLPRRGDLVRGRGEAAGGTGKGRGDRARIDREQRGTAVARSERFLWRWGAGAVRGAQGIRI